MKRLKGLLSIPATNFLDDENMCSSILVHIQFRFVNLLSNLEVNIFGTIDLT